MPSLNEFSLGRFRVLLLFGVFYNASRLQKGYLYFLSGQVIWPPHEFWQARNLCLLPHGESTLYPWEIIFLILHGFLDFLFRYRGVYGYRTKSQAMLALAIRGPLQCLMISYLFLFLYPQYFNKNPRISRVQTL